MTLSCEHEMATLALAGLLPRWAPPGRPRGINSTGSTSASLMVSTRLCMPLVSRSRMTLKRGRIPVERGSNARGSWLTTSTDPRWAPQRSKHRSPVVQVRSGAPRPRHSRPIAVELPRVATHRAEASTPWRARSPAPGPAPGRRSRREPRRRSPRGPGPHGHGERGEGDLGPPQQNAAAVDPASRRRATNARRRWRGAKRVPRRQGHGSRAPARAPGETTLRTRT